MFAGIAFGSILGLVYGLLYEGSMALVLGVGSGVAFGLAMYAIASSRKIKGQAGIALDGETLHHQGPANRFLNGEGVGGRLYLLDDRLMFKSHHFNIQNHQWELPLREIESLEFYNPLLMVPNGLAIRTTAGRRERFIVQGRKVWKSRIQERIDRLG